MWANGSIRAFRICLRPLRHTTVFMKLCTGSASTKSKDFHGCKIGYNAFFDPMMLGITVKRLFESCKQLRPRTASAEAYIARFWEKFR